MNSNPSLDKLEKLALAFQIKGRRLALPGLTALTSHFSWGDAMLSGGRRCYQRLLYIVSWNILNGSRP